MVEDQLLVWRSKRGDRSAFNTIYDKYLDRMLTVAMGLLGNAHDAEEVVQDVFVTFIASLSDFRLRGSLKAFLTTCVANRARDRLRRRQRAGRLAVRLHDDLGADPLLQATHDETLERLAEVLTQLPYEQREAIVLKMQGGLSLRALARQQNLPLGTVQTRYRSGMTHLRALMNGEKNR